MRRLGIVRLGVMSDELDTLKTASKSRKDVFFHIIRDEPGN